MAEKWIQKATDKMEKKGTVGSFSAAAKKAGKSTSAMATSILKPGSHASAKMKKKAQFAKNVAGGNTMLPASHPKAKILVEGRAHNLAAKKAVPQDRASNFAKDSSFDAGTNDATRSGRANKDIASARSANMACKDEFCDCDM